MTDVGDSLQLQIYVVAGVLGGICLLLTIASMFFIASLVSVKTKVALLQKAGGAAAIASSTAGDSKRGYNNMDFVGPEENPPLRPGDYVDDYRNRPTPSRTNVKREDFGRRDEYPMQNRNDIYRGVPGVRSLGDRYSDVSPRTHAPVSRYSDRRY